ncbi:MAG: D-alanyl-D-alanine carboxypeptidase [Rhizobiaceae bacterium]|nr:D-alanyl-D-alanine carboxypeptidase [Rhizobiaceae bacterium]
MFGLSTFVDTAAARPKYAGIVVDAKTGRTLYSENANKARYPASLTKMMTMYLMFEALADKRMSKKTRIHMSKYAASKPPSKLGIRPGGSLSAEQAIYALATKSANDVATAVAEHLGGSEAGFARIMTKKARHIGMRRTTFTNASGLPSKTQLTTARDMATLGIALREHFPQYYRYFSTTSFKYGKHRYGNHNRLLGRIKGVDGIKTGYTRASGFNLVSSVRRNGRSIVAVVMGGKTGKSRNAQMTSLIRRFLPKASRGKQKQLLASRKRSSGDIITVASLQTLPKTGPVPQFRSNKTNVTSAVSAVPAPAPTNLAQSRIQVAHTVEVATVANILAFDGVPDVSEENVREKLRQSSARTAPVPNSRPQKNDLLRRLTPPDPITTKTIIKPPVKIVRGWQIQIGATDSQASAMRLLGKAQSRAPRHLARVKTYTETVVKNSTTLYRARFTGFASQSAAKKACKYLKKRSFACLTIHS